MPSAREGEASRSQTDESLRAERARSDDELLVRSHVLEGQSDEVIARARDEARRVLELARERADRHMVDIGATAELTDTVAAERRREDAILTREHAVADADRLEEREQRRAAVMQILAHERVITDDALRTERLFEDRRVALQEDVLAGVSHDLRTLLTTVAVNASIVLLAPDVATARPAGAAIQRAGAQMADLLENLLELSTFDAANPTLIRSEVDVIPLTRDVVTLYQEVAVLRGVALAMHAEVESLIASVDGRRIKRLLINLLGNALKYTPEGGRIDVDVSVIGAEYELAVRDTGGGIPRAELGAIFERFHRAGRRSGFGLGLYICRRIAEAHGGRIWVESTLDAGSTFRVRLPRA
jgi:signal transduction histidine kinase